MLEDARKLYVYAIYIVYQYIIISCPSCPVFMLNTPTILDQLRLRSHELSFRRLIIFHNPIKICDGGFPKFASLLIEVRAHMSRIEVQFHSR
jgi:hypothetical protein